MKSPMKWSKTEPPKKRLTSPIVRIRSAERDNGMRQPLAAQCLQIFLQALRIERKAATKNYEGAKELFRAPKHIVARLDKFMPRLQKEESEVRKSMKNMCF